MKMTGRYVANMQIPVPNVNGQLGLDILQALLEPGSLSKVCVSDKFMALHGEKPRLFKAYFNIRPFSYGCKPVFDHLGRVALAFKRFSVESPDDKSNVYRIGDFQKNLTKALANLCKTIKVFFRFMHVPESSTSALVDFYFLDETLREKVVSISLDDIKCLVKVIEHGPSYKRTLNAFGEEKVAAIAGTQQNFLETAQQAVVRQECIKLAHEYSECQTFSGSKPIMEKILAFYAKTFPDIPKDVVSEDVYEYNLIR